MGYGQADGLRQKFTQKERDAESGLDYFLARYYSAAQGRFTSVDPGNAGAGPGDPQSWHGYAYARNNPLIYVDSLGLYYEIYDAKGNWVGRVKNIEELDKLGYTYVKTVNDAGTVTQWKDSSGNKYDVKFYEDKKQDINIGLDDTERLILEMERRASAMNQAIGIAAAVNLAPVVVIGGHAAVTGAAGPVTLGLTRAGPAAAGGGAVLNQLSRTDQGIFQRAMQ